MTVSLKMSAFTVTPKTKPTPHPREDQRFKEAQEAHEELSLAAPYFQFTHNEEMRKLAAQNLCYDQLTFDERRKIGDRALTRACEMAREVQRHKEAQQAQEEISLAAPYFQFAHSEEMHQLAAQNLCYDQLTFDERRKMGDRSFTRACEMARQAQRA